MARQSCVVFTLAGGGGRWYILGVSEAFSIDMLYSDAKTWHLQQPQSDQIRADRGGRGREAEQRRQR